MPARNTTPLGSSADEYAVYLKTELARWAVVVKATGVKIQ
jgi:hypothetical protein